MNRQVLDELKQQISLLDYLQAQDWRTAWRLSRGRLLGLCPLHDDHQPSFLVDPTKNLFYCYGCGRGGDVIRFAELFHEVRFAQALALLQQWRGLPPILQKAADFYRMQLHRHDEAVAYLYQRGVRSPELIEHMRIGYAPGGCLRGWLTQLGYPLQVLRQAGLVTGAGYDAYIRRIVFPLEANLYGRSSSPVAPAHRFLPGAKGGLYLWEQVQQCPEVIGWINQYLDYETLRRLADSTLNSYAHELLHFLRWWESIHHTDAIDKDALTESTLLDYVRFQSSQQHEVTGGTINQRVAIVERALRTVFPDAPAQIAPGFQHTY